MASQQSNASVDDASAGNSPIKRAQQVNADCAKGDIEIPAKSGEAQLGKGAPSAPTSQAPSRVSNTLEHQMQVNTDPKQPRGEPQLVGLTRLRYHPRQLSVEPHLAQPSQNYIIESIKNFFPDKQQSKRVTAMRENAIKMAQTHDFLRVTIDLPHKMIVEQINLAVTQPPSANGQFKKQSEFSKNYALLSCKTVQTEELCLKSAFSECVTREQRIEYNVLGVTTRLELIFAVLRPEEHSVDQIKIGMRQAEDIAFEDGVLSGIHKQEITTDHNEDEEILQSLPGHCSPRQSDPDFSKMLNSIEIVGFYFHTVPAITNLTYFMNLSFYLQSRNRSAEANEIEFMTGQLLVSTKRATQTVELFRKMQIFEKAKPVRTKKEEYGKLVNCAVFEVLICDALPTGMHMQEKIQSLTRLNYFLRARYPPDVDQRFPAQIEVTQTDSFSNMLITLPDCLRFIIACTAHRYEIVRIAALKILRYVLETLGCSLDYGMVFILKAMLKTYPEENERWVWDEDFDLEKLMGKQMSIYEFLFNADFGGVQPLGACTQWVSIEEPKSGSKRAMVNIYNNVLDTFISVLSSVSSHILHSIFYDVIEPVLLVESGFPTEVRVFSCKIADKIFTICQGDLVLTPTLLETLLTLTTQSKVDMDQTAQAQIKTLWNSIRQKVLPNYSEKGYQLIVDWLFKQLTDIQGKDGQDDRVRCMVEIITILACGRQKSEEEANQLIKIPNNERFGGSASSELFLLLTPLMYWLEYAIDREERYSLFLQVYQTIKDVLGSLPKGQCDLDMVNIMFPALQRASEFMEGNSPSQSMLKFLDLVLTDTLRCYQKTQRQQPPVEVQQFFAQMLHNFAQYLAYTPFEDSLFVFEKLTALSSEHISEETLCACIVGLIDKYSMKPQQIKKTMAMFMKFLLNADLMKGSSNVQQHNSPQSQRAQEILSDGGLDNQSVSKLSYFEMMQEFCFFQNAHCGYKQPKYDSEEYRMIQKFSSTSRRPVHLKQLEFRSEQDLHSLNMEKLQFFIDAIALMNETHITLFTSLITHAQFRSCLLNLIEHSESQVRLKSHEVTEALTGYFVQFCPSKTVYEIPGGNSGMQSVETEFISHERIYIAQILISVAKASLMKENDCYLQFNALILLDFLFQNLLPVPNFRNEELKAKRRPHRQNLGDDAEEGAEHRSSDNGEGADITMDVEILSISEETPELDVMDPAYLRMRMKLVFSLWPFIQHALNSPWSNIRSICYGLICSMLKVDINDYPREEPVKLEQHLSFEEQEHQAASQHGLRQIVLPMLYSLLASKESESKAGGLNILGSFCGLSYDFTGVPINQHLKFFQRNSQFVSTKIWELVFSLQQDWDVTIKEASVVLIQLCAPRKCILYFQHLKEKKERAKLDYMLSMPKPSDAYANGQFSKKQECPIKSEQAWRAISLFPTEHDALQVLDPQPALSLQTTTAQNFEQFMMSMPISLQQEPVLVQQIISMSQALDQLVNAHLPDYEDARLTGSKPPQQMSRRRQMELEWQMSRKGKKEEVKPQPEATTNFFVDAYADDQIGEIISIFRNDFKPPKNLWIEKQPQRVDPSNYGHHQQPPMSSSPDFFQEIYSDAIEQFNQHQMMMQQKQQDELQQQVSSGSSNVSSTSEQMIHVQKGRESADSSTPSPTQMIHIGQNSEPAGEEPKSNHIIEKQSNVPSGAWGPTSPVLVHGGNKNKEKRPTPTSQSEDEIVQVDEINGEEKKPLEPREGESQSQAQDLPFKKGDSPRHRDQRDMGCKQAQTYLSSLNKGYIAEDQLLNLQFNLLPDPDKKLLIKAQRYQQDLLHQERKKKKSQSPESRGQRIHKSKSKEKISTKTSMKQMSNLADLNYFIKSIEKDLVKNMNMPKSPSQIQRKLDEQMKQLGYDQQKAVSQSQKDFDLQHPQGHKTQRIKPSMKLLELNQLGKSSEENLTPSSIALGGKKQRSPRKSGHDSDSDFCRTQKHSKKQPPLLGGQGIVAEIRTHRDRSEGDDLSQRHENNSAGNYYPLLNQKALLTDRYGQQKPHGKVSHSTKHQSEPISFKQKPGKSQSKGYSSLAAPPGKTHSVLSPSLKRDQQSGGIVKMQKPGSVSAIRKQKPRFLQENSTQSDLARQPHSTRNRNVQEQGDKKQFSPVDNNHGKPPLKRKKSGPKPTLELQQPSYY